MSNRKSDAIASSVATLALSQVHRDFDAPWNQLHIDLDALQSNYRELRKVISEDSAMYVVLKADAYGHGLAEVGKTLVQSGCRHFAVETPQEGILLRKQDIENDILLLNPIPEWMAEMAVYYDFSVSVIHKSIIPPLEEAAAAMGKRSKLHLNVNVGLHRLGIPPSKLTAIAEAATNSRHLKLEAMYAQPRDDKNALEGFARLRELYDRLSQLGIAPNHLHFSNSTTLLAHPETAEHGARLGILLYGVLPPEQFGRQRPPFSLKPVMSLRSRVVQIRELSKGSKIGYRARTALKRDSVIGTLPIGYAHGLDRMQAKEGYVLIKSRKASFIGAISMNSCTVDLTDIDGVAIDDEATILGSQGKHEIVINDLAGRSDTISAELMVRFGQGVSRSYRLRQPDRIRIKHRTNGDSNYGIRYMLLKSESDFPAWLTTSSILDSLEEHLGSHEDPYELIHEALDYSLSIDPEGEGFVVLASEHREIVGVVVCARTNTTGFIPENVFVYVCVHSDYRNRGIGRSLVQEAINNTDGDVKVHVAENSPSIEFLKSLGFTGGLTEMRLLKGEKRWVQSKINIKRIKESGTTVPEPTKSRS